MLAIFKRRLRSVILRKLNITVSRYGLPVVLERHLRGKKGISIIDVGAHEGIFTESVDNCCSVKSGVLVELQPARARDLRARFRPPRFQVFEAAINEVAGVIKVEVNQYDATTSILKTKRMSPDLAALSTEAIDIVACHALTLDQVWSESEIGPVDLLKLDIQGAELAALRGAVVTLANTSLVWTEVSFRELYEGSCLFNDVFEFLTNKGFSLLEIEPGFRNQSDHLLQADCLFGRD